MTAISKGRGFWSVYSFLAVDTDDIDTSEIFQLS